MAVEVTTPDDFLGEVIGDLNSPPWPDPGHGGAQRRARRVVKALRTPVGDVRLRRRSAEQDAGARELTACSSTPMPVPNNVAAGEIIGGARWGIVPNVNVSRFEAPTHNKQPTPALGSQAESHQGGRRSRIIPAGTAVAKAKFERTSPTSTSAPSVILTTGRRR